MNAFSGSLPGTKEFDTPGAYMRRCRERAGLTRAAAAKAIARPVDWQRTRADIFALEQDQPGDYGRLLTALARVFPFDRGVFEALAAVTNSPDLPDHEFAPRDRGWRGDELDGDGA